MWPSSRSLVTYPTIAVISWRLSQLGTSRGHTARAPVRPRSDRLGAGRHWRTAARWRRRTTYPGPRARLTFRSTRARAPGLDPGVGPCPCSPGLDPGQGQACGHEGSPHSAKSGLDTGYGGPTKRVLGPKQREFGVCWPLCALWETTRARPHDRAAVVGRPPGRGPHRREGESNPRLRH